MVVGLAILFFGLFCAWIAARSGLQTTWVLFFNVLLATCVAVFVTPVVMDMLPVIAKFSLGCALTFVVIAVVTLFIAYAICNACLSGRTPMEFPKLVDTVVGGGIGFFTGVLLLSFLGLAFCLTPISDTALFRNIGLDADGQNFTINYVCWWSDRLHGFVRASGSSLTSRTAIDKLLALKKQKEPEPAAPPKPPEPVEPPPKPPFQLNPDLLQELARRRRIINSPDEIAAAVTNADVRILEIASLCTAVQFDEKQAQLLCDWTARGGTVWTSNDVLKVLKVQHSTPIECQGPLACIVSGDSRVSNILANCKAVELKDVAGTYYIQPSQDAVPLLVLAKDASDALKAGTPCWSLAIYKQGLVSDFKTVNLDQYEGGPFYENFCWYCIRREVSVPVADEGPPKTPQHPSKGLLTGQWKSKEGIIFSILDYGTHCAFNVSPDPSYRLARFVGSLQREVIPGKGEGLKGMITVAFREDKSKGFDVPTTVTVLNPDMIQIHCIKYPGAGHNGRPGPVNTTWTRISGPKTKDNPSGKPVNPFE